MDQRFCAACGSEVPEGSSFCGACGARTAADAPPAAIVSPPAEGPAVPPPLAPPADATPPKAPSNTRWTRIGLGIVGAGFLVFGLVKVYNAFFGAPSASSAARQMEDKIRSDFQVRGQRVSEVRLTPQGQDRMTGSVTAGTTGAPGSEVRYDCIATRQDRTSFRYQCVPAGALAAAAPGGTPAGTQTRTWRGSYRCGQGETGLEVTLRPVGQGRVEGTLSFFALPTNPGVPRGCYRVAGQADSVGRSIELRGGQWLRQPPGYHTVDLRGSIGADDGISGQVIGGECSQFRLQSVASPVEACP